MDDPGIYKETLNAIGHYVYALCEIDGESRKPFYIGKGQKNRCIQHLFEETDSLKVKKISELSSQKNLGIDILRHGLDDKTARQIEATCIDLLGVGELTNSVRGPGSNMGRTPLEELHDLVSGKLVHVSKEHAGLAFLINSTYKSAMSEIELFEATRGVWSRVPRDNSIKFAYATYGGIVKEVYEIHSWLPAGTQEYFTRTLRTDLEKRWEFIGKKAPNNIREIYKGKVISKERSFGTPFVRVGFDDLKSL